MNDARQLLTLFGDSVARYLSAGKLWWQLDRAGDTHIKLRGTDGMRITLWCGAISSPLQQGREDQIKFKVSGAYPPDTYLAPEEKPSINVGYSKGAKAVASDIERRFLSKYVPLYYEKLETQRQIERDRDARERVMATLVEWFGFKEIRDRDGHLDRLETENRRFPYRGRVTASYRIAPSSEHILFDSEKSERRWEVDIRLERLTMDQALRIAEALKEPAFPPEQLSLL